MHVRSDRRHVFGQERAKVWEAMGRVEEYRRWWPWLRTFEAEALRAGDVWECTVQPPLPYSLRFSIALGEVVPSESVRATVSGDVTGTAELELSDVAEGCAVRLRSNLSPTNPLLRGVALVARPVARFGHDWVIDTGSRQFAERAL